MTLHQSLDQLRAKFAWQSVMQAKKKLGDNEFSNYVSIAKKLPATISQCGLGQALAFEASKDDKVPHRLVFDHLQSWILHRIEGNDVSDEHERYALLDAISSRYDSRTYMRATTETQALLVWLRMLAESQDDQRSKG